MISDQTNNKRTMTTLIKVGLASVAVIALAFYAFVIVPAHIEHPRQERMHQAAIFLKAYIFNGEMSDSNERLKFMDELTCPADAKGSAYNYIIFLKDGELAVTKRSELRSIGTDQNNQRDRRFIAFAWPIKWTEDGLSMFAIAEDGNVYETDEFQTKPLDLFSGEYPKWNSFRGTWGSQIEKRWHLIGHH